LRPLPCGAGNQRTHKPRDTSMPTKPDHAAGHFNRLISRPKCRLPSAAVVSKTETTEVAHSTHRLRRCSEGACRSQAP
jgi:hypothetical protein